MSFNFTLYHEISPINVGRKVGRVHRKLTAMTVRKTTKLGMYGDGGNLWLQIKNGGKSWIFRYTVKGVQKEMGLGPVDVITLDNARVKSAELRLKLYQGLDPLIEKQLIAEQAKDERANAKTFDQCAHDYIEKERPTWRNAKHAKQWTSTLKTYASPVIGEMNIKDVGKSDILRILQPIWTVKTETASRLRQRIEAVIDFAIAMGFRTADNPAKLKGNLDKLLPKSSKVAKKKHFPALPYSRVKEFMDHLSLRTGTSARALEFLILTAARSGEVRGLKWDEIDFEKQIWIIPESRMKAGKEHRVPLSTAAIDVLNSQQKITRSGLVFPSQSGKELSDQALAKLIERINKGRSSEGLFVDPSEGNRAITVHGFRSTFRDWAGSMTHHPREVIEHALAHQLKDKAEAAYQRGDLLQKRVLLMNDWSKFCL